MYKQVIRCCSMIDVSLVDTVNDHFSGVAIALYDSKCFLIDAVCHKVFGKSTIVAVFDSRLPLFRIVSLICAVIVEVLNVYKIYIAALHLSTLAYESIHAFLTEECGSNSEIMLIIILLILT